MKAKPYQFTPALLWTLLIYWLLVMPASDVPSSSFLDEIYFDKWVHCGLFAMLVFLISFPFKKTFQHYTLLYLFIAIACAGYGIGMEYVQKYFTTDRDFDYYDMLADSTGCLLGFLFIQWQLKMNKKKRKSI